MLIDSPKIANKSVLGRELTDATDRGVSFPGSPTDGKAFQLTATFNTYAPGIYVYSERKTDWIEQAAVEQYPYDIGFSIFDRPKAADVVAKHIAARSFLIKEDFGLSMSKANVASTAEAVFKVSLDDAGAITELGTLTFAIGATEGVFAADAAYVGKEITVLRGETVVVTAPAVRDATLKSIDVTIAGRLPVGGF